VFASCSDDAGVLLWDVGKMSGSGVGGLKGERATAAAAAGEGRGGGGGGGGGGACEVRGDNGQDIMEGVEVEGGGKGDEGGEDGATTVRGRKTMAKGVPVSRSARQALQLQQEQAAATGGGGGISGGKWEAQGPEKSRWGKEALGRHKVVEKLAAPGLRFMHAGHLGKLAGVSWHSSIPWLLATVSPNTEEEVEGVVVQDNVVQVWRMARPGALDGPVV
jgi:hypothetical protein